MSLKPVEEMTAEEIAQERAAIAAERAAKAAAIPANAEGGYAVPKELDPTKEVADLIAAGNEALDSTEDEPEPEPWPHEFLDYGGLHLEVRKPNESALVAISMTSVPVLGAAGQMRIFTRFLSNHLSPTSFVAVVEAMTDPDSGVDIQGLITELTKLQS
jgi:hypothetical protein